MISQITGEAREAREERDAKREKWEGHDRRRQNTSETRKWEGEKTMSHKLIEGVKAKI